MPAGTPVSGRPDRPEDGSPLVTFLADMRRLRRECSWKRAQTHRSLARYLQEEAHEAIDAGDPDHLREELGDLLLQVYFHAVIAEEAGDFSLDDVARGIDEKMRRRNPHVFGGGSPDLTPVEVDRQWQEIKATERPRESAYDGIATTLPALLLATKVLEREPWAATGLPAAGDASAALGDRILALVAEAVEAGVDPEQALRAAVRRAVPTSATPPT
jgi:XTP/dITP diphosphohydrolase